EYRPEDVIDQIDGGVMFICVEDDDTTPEHQSIRLYEQATAPKKIVVQTGTSHYEAYNMYFEDVAPQIVEWFEEHLTHEGLQIREEVE
ncbi:MAG: alpha/beta hydrolase, partial [Halobacteriales archaeon]|nr:alpha/beta hydrolase [Halobacteriales archaeon]